jgi:DNA-binding NarL/FixJ family response regulator
MNPNTIPLRILVVEDQHDTAKFLTKLLSMAGHCAESAETFGAALAAARAKRFDVLVCDIGLGDGDGCDLLAEVSALYPIKAIAVSGYNTPEDVRRFRQAGFAGFLLKPVEFTNLHETIETVVAGGRLVDPESLAEPFDANIRRDR